MQCIIWAGPNSLSRPINPELGRKALRIQNILGRSWISSLFRCSSSNFLFVKSCPSSGGEISYTSTERSSFPKASLNFISVSTMSSPAEFYNSLPPISKAYGTLCLLATTAFQLGLYDPMLIALDYELVFKHFEVWRLFTNFFFLGKFSINFGIRLLMIARYGVQLENGPFQRRTADFLWMMIFGSLTLLVLATIPIFRFPVLGISLVFMLLYVWSREFPNAQINIYGLVTLKAFYLPWAMLALDVIFGSPLVPDLLGILAGHLYYFLTVLHPLAGGKNILRTPLWIQRLVSRWRIGAPPMQRAAVPDDRNTSGAFRGRSYRLNG